MRTPKPKKLVRPKQTMPPAPTPPPEDPHVLRLFVAGASERSHQAVLRARELSEHTLKGRVKLEVIDIYQQPALARKHQIVATPTLILGVPLPVRRFIGNLANLPDLFSLSDLNTLGRLIS